MKRLFLLLFLVSMSILVGFTCLYPYNDWRTYGLKGKVKVLTETLVIKNFDTIHTYHYHFTSAGRLERVIGDKNKYMSYMNTRLYYDQEGHILSSSIRDQNGTMTDSSVFLKEMKGDTIVLKSKRVYNLTSSQHETEQYWFNGLRIKEITTDLPMGTFAVSYNHNEKGWPVETTVQMNDTSVSKSDHIYEKIDRKGNWTRSVSKSGGEGYDRIQLRKINYY